MVQARVEAEAVTVEYPTYPVSEPEKHPLFFEKRVYQGSNGKVYPLPFIDKVFDVPRIQRYQAIRLENEFVRVLLLPDFGGRIHAIQDKTNQDYDIFYHQKVIKPALVGLAGPWISGGVEFNWPQHHRPGTFMPTDWAIEHSEDGSAIAWMSEHDPLNRLKGMHGVRLAPDSALVELRVRLFNRTPYLQTFLWWANAAVKVHADYRSFFPPDVHYVADHAKRAVTSFPNASGYYYGVDYHSRPGRNDLTSYENIPVPTSYMVVDSSYGFVGGFDYRANGGFVHFADPSIAPGKKQWTWGHAAFGRAWDRELSDDGAPYFELMGGVYTDNQPDFSYLHPYETKTFSQFWWPIQQIGPVQNANRHAAIRCVRGQGNGYEIGLVAPREVEQARLVIEDATGARREEPVSLRPGRCWQTKVTFQEGAAIRAVRLIDSLGRELVRYEPADQPRPVRLPEPAREPKTPSEITSSDELFLVGEHLEQYRHPTRDPEVYWQEAVNRDAGDYRSRVALARRCIGQFQYQQAIEHLEKAVQRLSDFHPNPVTGEAHYYSGIAYRFRGEDRLAEKALGKASWDNGWRQAAKYELALLACRRNDFAAAFDHLGANHADISENSLAAVLKAIITEKNGDQAGSAAILTTLLQRDPLDHWASYELARQQPDKNFATFLAQCRNDAQTILDLAFNYIDAGFFRSAIELVELHKATPIAVPATPNPGANTLMTEFVLAWLYAQIEQNDRSAVWLGKAQGADPSFLFPCRSHETQILEWSLAQSGSRRNAAYGLGNLYYDRRRHADAITTWEIGVQDDPAFAPLRRNLGLAYWNHQHEPVKARQAYERAVGLAPNDGRLVYEYDQLRKKLNDSPADRLAWLENQATGRDEIGGPLIRLDLVIGRDDFCVEYLSLLNLKERHAGALEILAKRRFHPWEGGEGKVLEQYRIAQVALGRQALASSKAELALEHFAAASQPPSNLGEEFHYLQSRSDLNFWKGEALNQLCKHQEAAEAYIASANEAQDFQQMAVKPYSSFTYYRGLALLALERTSEANQLFTALRDRGRELQQLPGKIDYFATSLPNMLVFEDDLTLRNQIEGKFLEGLALLQLEGPAPAKDRFQQVLALDPSHYEATDQLRMLTASTA